MLRPDWLVFNKYSVLSWQNYKIDWKKNTVDSLYNIIICKRGGWAK